MNQYPSAQSGRPILIRFLPTDRSGGASQGLNGNGIHQPRRGKMKKRPKTILITQYLILLNVAIWAGYAIFTLLTRNDSHTGISTATWIMSALALASALALVVVVLLLRQQRRSGYYLGLILLTLIAILSITDQLGLLDILSLLISLAPLILLIRDRKWYLQKE